MIKKSIERILLNFCFLLILIPVGLALAQSLDSEELNILISPQNPQGGELLFLEVFSNLPNLDRAFITWKKDGVVEKSGFGLKNHKTIVSKVGASSLIGVTVEREDGVTSASIRVRPGEVYLIWEADSYTPPFYKGKALASHQSEVRVVAIPNLVGLNGSKLNTGDLLYEWSLDGFPRDSQSGIGKNIFKFSGPLVSKPVRVSVVVSSERNQTSAGSDAVVDFINPILVFYKKNPLTGIKNNLALSTGTVQGNESTFVVEPYFFSRKSINNNSLEFNWVVDGKKLEVLNKSKEIIFSPEIAGKSAISVSVSNPASLLQTIRRGFNVVVLNNE